MFLGSIDLERIKTFNVYFYQLQFLLQWQFLFILKFDFINDR